MLELVFIYWLPITASIIFGGALSQVGAQLAARERSMETLCVSQGATLGILIGIATCHFFSIGGRWESGIPFLAGLVVALITHKLSIGLLSRWRSTNSSHFVAIFSVLTALAHLVTAVFPSLENHMTQKYLGDLSTLSEVSALTLIFLGLLTLGALIKYRKIVTKDSFSLTVLGETKSGSLKVFNIFSLIVICVSVQLVGFLFTCACLFIPTALLAKNGKIGLNDHLLLCLISAAASSGIGFVITIISSTLPTVPTIVVLMAVLSYLSVFRISNSNMVDQA